MKQNNLNPSGIKRMSFANPAILYWISILKKTTLLLTLSIAFCITGCSKNESANQGGTAVSGKGKASVSVAQPAPGGKVNFSVAFGKFEATTSCWVRLANWTFNPAAGTVAMSYWNWDTNNDVGKTALNSHLCTMDDASSTCNVWSPTGWMVGGASNPWTAWSGTYTYNTTTGALHIVWSNGLWEDWTVTNPQTGIARVVWTAASYSTTHGRGYGSNAAWTTYVPVTSIPRIFYSGGGKKVTHYYYNPGGGAPITNTIAPSTPGTWANDHVDFSPYTSASTGSPTLHQYNCCGTACAAPNPGTHTGGVNHLGGNNTSRNIVYNVFAACLAADSGFPCYTGNLHPLAMQQVINDSGAMVGMVGIEAQNMAGYNNWEFQLRDITIVP